MTQTPKRLPQPRTESVSRDALVQAALKEITTNYREASLSNVAREYGVSLAYVSECVRARTGRTYKELLQRHRMETAARLLRRSDLNIQQIITQVGYENTSYFYRLFHERYGLSPREYRMQRAARAHS
ncbi:MAG: helix-turn-helix transcriptional regulator [Faecalibacterium sp.]